MSEIYSYELEPYRLDLDVEVVATGEDAGRPFAVLDDTILFPEGGGQPADHGLSAPPPSSSTPAAAPISVRPPRSRR